MHNELIESFKKIIKIGKIKLNRSDQRTILEVLKKVIGQELHNLRMQPDILWQQLFNRLQWYQEKPIVSFLTSKLDHRTSHGEALWFRTLTPFREAESYLKTFEHKDVRTCSLSPDGARLCSVADSIKIWDIHSGAELSTIEKTNGRIESCTFSHKGDLLITGSHNGKVHIRDSRTLTSLVDIQLDNEAVYCAANPIDSMVAIACNTCLRILKLPFGSEKMSYTIKGGKFTCCAFSKDGKFIATGDEEGIIRLIKVNDTFKEILKVPFKGKDTYGIKTCTISPNLAFIAVINKYTKAVILLGGPDPTGKLMTSTLTLFNTVNDCCISSNGQLLVVVSDDRLAWIYKLHNLKQPSSALEGHIAPVTSCSFSNNTSILATTSRDNTIKLWNPGISTSPGGIAGHSKRVTAVTYAPDGSFIVSASADMTLKIWTPVPTVEKSSLEGHLTMVQNCIILQKENIIVSLSRDGIIKLWDPKSSQEITSLYIDNYNGSSAITASPDGSKLVVSCGKGICLLDFESKQCIKKADISNYQLQDCTFTTNGLQLLIACEDNTLRLWDVETWREIKRLHGHTDLVTCCDIVPKSSLGVSGSCDGTLRLWNLKSGKELHLFPEHKNEVWDCAVSNDGKLLVSVSWDGILRVWDIMKRNPIANFPIKERLRSVAFHPLKSQVVCGDYNGWIHVIDIMGVY